jgi:hypothetical protein
MSCVVQNLPANMICSDVISLPELNTSRTNFIYQYVSFGFIITNISQTWPGPII